MSSENYGYTAVQHSAMGFKRDMRFAKALEEAAVTTAKEAAAVETAGGRLFPTMTEARDFVMGEQYPPEVTVLVPCAPGSFSLAKVGGLRIYVPPPVEVIQDYPAGKMVLREQGEANQYAIMTEDGKWLLGLLHNGEMSLETQRARLQRIVALWNAFDGVPTEQIRPPAAFNFATFDEWFEAHGKQNAKKECNHVGVGYLMKLAWEVARELKA